MYTHKQYERVKSLLYRLSGITLGDNKEIMIANRLDKLIRTLKRDDIDGILNDVEKGVNVDEFVSSFTTNKTNFFREDFHFDDLKNRVIKESLGKGQPLKIYCSASSTGEEPYSILMTAEESKEIYNAYNFSYSLLATDIDLDVLDTARKGVYEWDKNQFDFPSWIKPAKYFKRRPHPTREGDFLIKAKDTLTKNVRFDQHNLMLPSYPFAPNEFDVIFCRNVLIYFSQADQNKILKNLFRHLKVGGTLYLGHSENPLDLTSSVSRLGQNIFVKTKEYS